jgi:ABC-2 type transport system ATP-binding protein
VSFSVAAGQLFGFVGSNGAGKTTTMRIVLGVLNADSGEVRWDGAPIGPETRRRIGYMPEERGLYPRMKVGEQLVYLARLHGLSEPDAVASMEHWTEVLGVAERRADAVEKLSLGNQQRVQLASALVHNPEILVLDEPFSGLDPVAVAVMSDVLREQADRGVPVVFSSHQLELVERLCDRVGIVKAGRMVVDGTIDELRTTPTQQWTLTGAAERLNAPPGSTVTQIKPGTWLVEADAPEAVQAVLASALAAGAVTGFFPVRPSLTDLYRDVVASVEEAA